MRLLVVCAGEEDHGPRAGAGLLRAEMHRIRAGGDAVLRRPKHSVIVEAADSTKGQSFTCSAVSIWRHMAPVSSLSTPFYKLFQDFRKSKTAALQAQSRDTNTRNQSAVSHRQIVAD